MRKLLFVCTVAVVVVAGIAIYSVKVLRDVERRDQDLKAAFHERAVALRTLDRTYPYTARPALDPARFPAWLAVRTKIAEEFASRIEERSKGPFHARETHNTMLEIARDALTANKMSLAEYQATSRRWRALLAREEFRELQRTWAKQVFNREHPPPPGGNGLPLPDPARDAKPPEIALIREHELKLSETLTADLLGPLLDGIEKNTYRR